MKFRLYKPQAINEVGSRKNQEDSIFPSMGTATEDSRLFLVCDGMGGYEKGEEASRIVADAFSNFLTTHCDLDRPLPDAMFSAALSAAYDALDAADPESESKMGTTLTMLCLHRGGCLAAHIGDSRIYHLRPSTGEILYRSRDHSLVQQLYDMGEISYEEMKTSPKKNVVLRAMSPHQDARSKAELVHITDIRPGDYFYLCTDGMLEKMEDETLLEILSDRQIEDSHKRQRLIDLTSTNGDNHSAYIIHVERVESEENDSLQPNDEAQARAANKALNRQDETTDVVLEPSVTMVSPGNANAAPSTHTVPTSPRTTKKSGKGKKFIIWLIILLVAILTGFTVFNMMSQKKEAPVKPRTTVVEDPDRIEYRKEAPSPAEGAGLGRVPAAPDKPKPARTTTDKQTETVNDILDDAARREQEKTRAEQEKAEKAQKEKQEEEARKKKQEQVQPRPSQTRQLSTPPPQKQKAAGITTIHVSDQGDVRLQQQK